MQKREVKNSAKPLTMDYKFPGCKVLFLLGFPEFFIKKVGIFFEAQMTLRNISASMVNIIKTVDLDQE